MALSKYQALVYLMLRQRITIRFFIWEVMYIGKLKTEVIGILTILPSMTILVVFKHHIPGQEVLSILNQVLRETLMDF
jgi:hypothetical protein